jgi:predicted membrane channel-forming protein YqfA (hemolysin III family)
MKDIIMEIIAKFDINATIILILGLIATLTLVLFHDNLELVNLVVVSITSGLIGYLGAQNKK